MRFVVRRFVRRFMQALFAVCVCASVAHARPYPCRVVRVYDGDTITVSIDVSVKCRVADDSLSLVGIHLPEMSMRAALEAESLRLAGIDAPELRGKGVSAEEKARAKLARDALIELLPPGSDAICELDPDKQNEKWGRLIGRVMFRGKDVAAVLLERGLVHPYDGGPR